KDLDKPISVLVGLAAGVPVAMLVEKAVGKKSTVSGLFGIDGTKLTRILKPAVNIALGMTVHQLTSNPKIKLAGIGLAANGGLIAIKDFLGKDILKGFEDADVGSPEQEQTYKVIENVIEERPNTPLNLPLLDIDEIDNETDSYIEGVIEKVSDSPRIEKSSEQPKPEEEEIILSSDRPEDNFEIESEQVDIEENDVSGNPVEAAPQISQKQTVYIPSESEIEEELDFSDIP
ncbi:MAG: hypothetical protein KAS04_05200, partial [Candidatus Aenigmarchaeota archaeon]|nr:hypothetical protein [Candidatus Aenigmarchaeota archaeon]